MMIDVSFFNPFIFSPPVLEPDFYLGLREPENGGQLGPAGAGHVLCRLKFQLQPKSLLLSERRSLTSLTKTFALPSSHCKMQKKKNFFFKKSNHNDGKNVIRLIGFNSRHHPSHKTHFSERQQMFKRSAYSHPRLLVYPPHHIRFAHVRGETPRLPEIVIREAPI